MNDTWEKKKSMRCKTLLRVICVPELPAPEFEIADHFAVAAFLDSMSSSLHCEALSSLDPSGL